MIRLVVIDVFMIFVVDFGSIVCTVVSGKVLVHSIIVKLECGDFLIPVLGFIVFWVQVFFVFGEGVVE